jgi:hypothetical protein
MTLTPTHQRRGLASPKTALRIVLLWVAVVPQAYPSPILYPLCKPRETERFQVPTEVGKIILFISTLAY